MLFAFVVVVAVPDRPAFSIKLHHGGKIEGEKYKSYVGGEIDYFDLCHADFMSIHEINKMVEKCGHNDTMLYYYIDPRGDLNHGLMELQTDEDIMQFCGWVNEYKLMEVYCHHLTVEEIYELQKKKELEQLSQTKSSVVIEEILDDGEILTQQAAIPHRQRKGVQASRSVAALEWTHDHAGEDEDAYQNSSRRCEQANNNTQDPSHKCIAKLIMTQLHQVRIGGTMTVPGIEETEIGENLVRRRPFVVLQKELEKEV